MGQLSDRERIIVLEESVGMIAERVEHLASVMDKRHGNRFVGKSRKGCTWKMERGRRVRVDPVVGDLGNA